MTGECIVTFPSMTYAQKACRALEANGISGLVTKLPQAFSEKGCAWGLKADCRDLDTVKKILAVSDIYYKRIYQDKGGNAV